MKTKIMFGLLALAMMASVVSAEVFTYGISDSDALAQNLYVAGGATLRYVGPSFAGYTISGFVPIIAETQAAAYQVFDLYSPSASVYVENTCPRVNGVLVCA